MPLQPGVELSHVGVPAFPFPTRPRLTLLEPLKMLAALAMAIPGGSHTEPQLQ